jgi:hypothetical protein
MDIRNGTLVAAAIFALAATAANASVRRDAPPTAKAHGRSTHVQSATADAATGTRSASADATPPHPAPKASAAPQIYRAPFPPYPIVTPRYVYYPAATPTANPAPDPNACADSGNDCTALQLCEFYGENCGSLTAADLSDASASPPVESP